LPSDFPPPRTLDARPGNLPAQLTSFIGREQEVAEVKGLLAGARLVTLTGPGGAGKTRLSLQVASELLPEFGEGAFFADLSAVTDAALVPAVVASALGIPEDPERPILEAVERDLRDRELLLVIDNFEQVVDAASAVEELLEAAPKLKVLVTSREGLGIRGEREYVVPPLESPDPARLPDLPTLRRVGAVRLFTERALAASPRFIVTEENAPAVAEITARLDGLPLAIELAATRTKVLTPEQMLPRLQQRLSILTTGARTLPQRQRTLRDAIAWSYELLEPPEQRFFALLAVFNDGWTLEAAEAVCGSDDLGLDVLDGLTSLVDKSLIRRTDAEGDGRFSMLETIREFALERLADSGELEEMRERHAEHVLAFAVEAEPHLTADDQAEWLDRCDAEHANLRAALRWAIDAEAAPPAQEAAGALWRFWQQRGHLAEGRRWLDEILAMPAGQDGTRERSAALTGAAGIAWWQNDRAAAGIFYEEALAIERKLGDPLRIAGALYNEAFVLAARGDIDGAMDLLDETLELYRSTGDERGVARVLVMSVMRDAMAGDWDGVISRIEEVVSIWRSLGDRLQRAFDLVWLAFAYGRAGRREDARAAALESLELFREVDNDTGVALAFLDLAFLLNWEKRHEDALRMAAVSRSVRERAGGGEMPGFAGLLEGDPAAEARAELPGETADRAWAEGCAMDVEEAIALVGR
jgi:predicted ATPase